MLRLRKLTHMCSRTVSDPANRFRKTRKKKSSAVPLFRSGHMSAICARLGSKGKVGVQRGRKTAGCPSFLPTAVGTASSPRRAPRRSRHPQAAHPLLRFSENSPPRQGEHAYAVRAPRLSGAGKSCRLSRANRLRSSCAPVNRCRKRVPPVKGEPHERFVHPVKRAPCKSKFPKENPHAIG